MKLISQSAIQPLVIGSATEAKKAYEILLNKGIFIPLIRYPAVPKDSARLRLSLTAQHTEEDILKLVAALKPMGDIFKTND